MQFDAQPPKDYAECVSLIDLLRRYEPALTVPSIDKFLAVVAADEYGCFFG